jgi:autotransporter-associated beta strand protein
VASPATAPTTALSPLLQFISTGTTVVGTTGNQMCRYYKPSATALVSASHQYSFSAANATPRPMGFFSFKIVQNTPPSPAVAGSEFFLRLGSNDNTKMSSSATAFIDLKFTPSVAPATTCAFSVRSGANTQSVITTVSATAQSTIKIWYNSGSAGMPYNDPAGASQTLSAGSYVCYVNNVLASSSASGTALVSFVTTGGTLTSTTVGKLAFGCASGNAVDFSVDDIYAGDTAPTLTTLPITSGTTASAMVGYPFTFPVVADATTYEATSLPGGLSINPTSGLITGTPTTAGRSTAALSVRNGAGVTGSGSLEITVAPAPTSIPVMSGATTASGNVATTFSYQIVASNTPRSYSATSLPGGLTLDTAKGLISGTPTTVGDTTVTLTAENPAGTSSSQDLTISIGISPPNIFTGSNPSLNTASSWSLGSSPTTSGNPGSYTDLVFSSTVYPLTTTSGNVFGKSWNVTNGSSYTFSSVNTAQTTFKIGNNSPAVTPFYNSVAASNDVLVYLTNGSSMTFSPSNTTVGVPESLVSLYNSGSLEIGSGSVLNIKASLIDSGQRSITKKGAGTLILGTNNTYRGGTTLEAGILLVNNSEGLGTGAMTLAGGTLANTVDLDLSHIVMTPTTSGSITFDKLSGSTTTINGATKLNVESQTTLSTYTLAGNSDTNNLVTKQGLGTLWLRGGGATTVMGGWRVEAGTLYVSTTSSSGIGTGPVTMAGGNLKFSKGVSSSGAYTGQGQDTALQVLADTTITLDPNPLTLPSNNTVSFTNLIAGQQTIHVVKGALTKSSATELGYTDPSIIFSQASLSGSATTFDVAANVEAKLQAATGSGGVTKTGSGKLTLANNTVLYAAKATATLAGDAVTSIAVTYSGDSSYLYTTAPVVTIVAPASGTTATATAILTDGLVTSVAVVDGGTGYTSAPNVTIASPAPVPNSYSGVTTINAGTLALSGSLSSRLAFATTSVLETALVSSNSPTTTSVIDFASGSKVRPVGDPTLPSYTLVTAAGGITGTPTLEAPITGYSLAIQGNSLVLTQGGANAAPVITAAQGFSVAENVALATVVGTVVATDADANSTLSGWTIVSGNTGSAFAINAATGQITVAGAINYEGTQSYSLGVTVSDGTATSAVGTVVVTVTNVSEYSDVFGSSSPTADDNGDGIPNLMAYSLGATSPSSVVVPPALNTADSTKLTITALIRINDPKVSVVGVYGLAPGTWVTGSPITGAPSSSQTGAVAGVTQRQDFNVLRGTDSKKFMYLKATQTP